MIKQSKLTSVILLIIVVMQLTISCQPNSTYFDGVIITPTSAIPLEQTIVARRETRPQNVTPHIHSSAYISDSKQIAFATEAGIIILDYPTFAVSQRWDMTSPPYALTYSSDKELLVSSHEDNSIQVWSVDSGNLIESFQFISTNARAGHLPPIVKLSPNGDRLAILQSTTLQVWDIKTPAILYEIENGGEILLDVDFSSNGKLLATVPSPNDFRGTAVWDATNGQPVTNLNGRGANIQAGDRAMSVSFSQNDKYIATSFYGCDFSVWQVESFTEQVQVDGEDYTDNCEDSNSINFLLNETKLMLQAISFPYELVHIVDISTGFVQTMPLDLYDAWSLEPISSVEWLFVTNVGQGGVLMFTEDDIEITILNQYLQE